MRKIPPVQPPSPRPIPSGKSDGFVLPLVMILLGLLTLTGAAVYTSCKHNLSSTKTHIRNVQALFQAKAGGMYVIDKLTEDLTSNTVVLDQPTVTVNYPPPTGYNFDPVTQLVEVGDGEAYYFQVTGRAEDSRTTFEIVFRSSMGGPFPDFFSDDTMTLSGGGNIVGNAASNNDIVNSGGSTITGDATPGPGYSVSDPSNVTGDTTAATNTLVIPPIDPVEVASAMAVNNNAALPPLYYDAVSQEYEQSGGTYTLPAGVYYFTGFKTSGGAITEVGGPVTIYCSGKFVVSGGGFINPSGNPDNLVIKSTAVNEVIEWSGTSDCAARVFGPNVKETKVTGGGTLHGSILTAGKLTASGGSTLAGDGGGGGGGGDVMAVSAWREVF